MAYTTLYGPWYGGSGKGRFVVEIEDLPAVTKNTTGVWVRSNWYLEFSKSTWDASNTFDPNGSFEQNPFGPINIGTSANPVTWQLIWERDIWVNLQYGRNTGVHVAGNIVGINNVGTTIYIDQWFNLPVRPYQLPDPATNLTNTYVNDGRVDLAWTPHYGGSYDPNPWFQQYIDRTETGDWNVAVNISGELGGQPTSWSDTSLQPNKRYDYRHTARNTSGFSSYAYAPNPIYTTPAAPTQVAATKQADGSIKVTATNNAPWVSAFEFSDSPDGSNWSVLTDAASTPTYTHTSPNQSVTHRYRVRAKTPDGKWSAYSTVSNVVQLQAPPNPPTWANLEAAYDATAQITTGWTHNPVDTTLQTAYEAQRRTSTDNGATWSAWTSTGKITSTTQSRTWAASTFPQNALVELQVCTWGAHATASEWSASTSFRTSARPTVGITSPAANATIPSTSATVGWAYSDVEGSAQSAFEVVLFKVATPAVEVGRWQQSGPANTLELPYRLENNTTYRVDVRVRDGVGLWSTYASRQFTVTYLHPPLPEATVTWDRTRGAVVLQIINTAPSGSEPAAVFNRVYRDGKLIATNVPVSTTFTDPLALPAGSTYVVEAVSDLPSESTVTVQAAADPEVLRRFWLNAGTGWQYVASFWANVKRSQTQGRIRNLDRYSGRELEVETIGEGRISRLRVNGTILLTEDSPDDFFTIANAETSVCYRDRYGAWFVSIEPVDSDAEVDSLANVSVSLTQIDYTDPVRGV